jgi:hypothetical protein
MIACLLLAATVEPPTAPTTTADLAGYNEHSLLELLAEFSANIEIDRPGAVIYIDVGLFSAFVLIEQANLMNATLKKQLGVTAAVGVATNKFSAYIAARAINPGRVVVVIPGSEADFLAPFTINYLPLDEELARRFKLFGLKTLGQLVALPTPTVLRQFGFHGRWLQQLAGGKDNRPLVPGTIPETWQSHYEFDGPVSDSLVLQQQCGIRVKSLSQQLLDAGRGTRLLTLTLHLENGTNWQEQVTLARATSDSVKLWYATLDLLGQAHITAGVVAITLQLAGLVPLGGQQLALFPSSNRQFRRLLHELVVYYGTGRFFYTTLTNSALLLPEQRFQLDEFEL